MTTAEQNRSKTETKMFKRIERGLASARAEGRFNDVITHLDELVPIQRFSESQELRESCARILRGESAPAFA
jgi:hypothetical protein